MTYIKVVWKHSHENEPVLLFSELDEKRFEIRKVEVFRDGTMGFANETHSSHSHYCELGSVPVPALEDIAKDPEFEPTEIEEREFGQIWDTAVKRGMQ